MSNISKTLSVPKDNLNRKLLTVFLGINCAFHLSDTHFQPHGLLINPFRLNHDALE